MMNKQTFLLIFIGCCGIFIKVSNANVPKVQYSNGWIVGKTFKTTNFKEFDGFFGIPFAQPPVGDLRFKDPQPFMKIFTENNPYNATEEKLFCVQKNYLLPNPIVMGTEDCLYLYVYRPNLKSAKRRLLPVIVYIHGGAFFSGAAGPSISGGEYFMETEDVVFVTMSYRLGPLGFISTGDGNISGNFGLKDQSFALKWVKKNIEKFGGDPNNISLMGQSAGAASVHLHMMSSWSKNLFHKAIILSGNGIAPYAYVLQDPLAQAKKFAEAAGIKGTQDMSNSQLSDELRKVDVTKLVDASDAFKIWSIDPLVIGRPVVEDCGVVNGFLCEDPLLSWQNGNYNRIPIVTGYMQGDGGVRALSYFSEESLLKELNDKFRTLFPKLLEIDDPKSESETAKRVNLIVDRYLNGNHQLEQEDLQNLVQIYTDISFVTPLANTLLQMLENYQKSHAFFYKFNFKGPYSFSTLYTGTLKDFGVVHQDELIYLLKSPLIFPKDFEAGSREALFRARFVKFFTNFATFGHHARIDGKRLQRCTKNEALGPGSKQLRCNYIDFNDKISIKYDDPIDFNAVDFWNKISDSLKVSSGH